MRMLATLYACQHSPLFHNREIQAVELCFFSRSCWLYHSPWVANKFFIPSQAEWAIKKADDQPTQVTFTCRGDEAEAVNNHSSLLRDRDINWSRTQLRKRPPAAGWYIMLLRLWTDDCQPSIAALAVGDQQQMFPSLRRMGVRIWRG